MEQHRTQASGGGGADMDQEEDDDDLCAICYSNKNSSTLKPCGVRWGGKGWKGADEVNSGWPQLSLLSGPHLCPLPLPRALSTNRVSCALRAT